MKLIFNIFFLYIMLVPIKAFTQANEPIIIAQGDEITMSSQYTINLKSIKLKDRDSQLVLKIRSVAYGRGGDMVIAHDRITFETGDTKTVVAENIPDGLGIHDYTVIKRATIRIFRDGVQIASVADKANTDDKPCVAVFGIDGVESGYSITLDSQEESIEPEIGLYEKNIENMLLEFDNLADDPYCCKGFKVDVQGASSHGFSTSDAVYVVKDADAFIECNDVYSGKYCIRLEGKTSLLDGHDGGVALEQNITMRANRPYLIRAMVKSNDYDGKIGIVGENAYIHITDTDGEWKQVEGLFFPGETRTGVYVGNDDSNNSGTLLIDNFEVYEGFANTSIGLKESVPSASVAAGTIWSPVRDVDVYVLGMNDDGEHYSQIDTSKVNVIGSVYLVKKVNGSQMYSLFFPGNLSMMTVTGNFDGKTYNDEPIYNGIDYVVQRFDYPYFKYVDMDDTLTNGCYLIQFVDNFDGLNVRISFDKSESDTNVKEEYMFLGNPLYTDYEPEKKFYKFKEANQRFELTERETIKPFEAYIATTAVHPVPYFTPDGSTGIQRLNGTDGSRMSIRPIDGGIEINALKNSYVSIYTVTGQKIAMEKIHYGQNIVNLDAGVYIVGGKKVLVK